MKRETFLRRYLLMNGARSAALGLVALVLLASCDGRGADVSGLAQLDGRSAPVDAQRVEELQQLVEEYGRIVNDKVQAVGKQADYLKLLAHAYISQALYGPALSALEEALILQPENHVLHQLAGVAAGQVGKAQGRAVVRNEYFAIAEYHYRTSVALDSGFIDALYGLAVLYVFELDRAFDALPHLERILGRVQTHVPALFVLARAHVELGNIDEAIRAYDRIIAGAADAESRAVAERNRRLLAGSS